MKLIMEQFPTIPQQSDKQTESDMPPQEPDQPEIKTSEQKGWRSALSTILIIIAAPIIALLLTAFVFQSYEVDGPSMENTLQHQDRLIILKVQRTWARITRHSYIPNRGDVIIFVKHGGIEGDSDKQLIKRVIGLPGDQVIIRDGAVTIKNKENPNGFNPDVNSEWSSNAGYTTGNIDLIIPDGEIFALGDNRGNSLDSRAFGTVPASDIVGKLSVRMLPLSKAKFF